MSAFKAPRVRDPDLVAYPDTDNLYKFKANFLESDPPPSYGKMTFVGTVKIHGANITIVFKDSNKETSAAQFQSRNCILSSESDPMGAMKALSAAPLHLLVDEILRVRGKGDTFQEIMIAGEWAGRGVHTVPLVGILDMPLLYAIFNIRIDNHWVRDMREYSTVALPEFRIYNVAAVCPTYEIELDLAGDTSAAEDLMEELTVAVGNCCPFAAAFLKILEGEPRSIRGEGIVWVRLMEEDSEQLYNFKTKDKPFLEFDPSQLVRAEPLTNPREASVAFVEYACTERRLEHGLEYLVEIGADLSRLDRKNKVDFTEWVVRDTIKEEGCEMSKFGAEEKIVKNLLRGKASKWLNSKLAGNPLEAPECASVPPVCPGSAAAAHVVTYHTDATRPATPTTLQVVSS